MVQCSVCDCQDVPVWSSVVSVIVRMFLCGPDCQGVPVWCNVVSVIFRVFLCGPVWCL